MSLPNSTHSPFLDTATAASYIGLSRATLESWRSKGKGPEFYKIGRLVYYRREDLDAWTRQRRRRSTVDPGPRSRKPGRSRR